MHDGWLIGCVRYRRGSVLRKTSKGFVFGMCGGVWVVEVREMICVLCFMAVNNRSIRSLLPNVM